MSLPPRQSVLITDAHVLALDGAHTTGRLDIYCEDGEIQEVSPRIHGRNAERHIDASGSIALPGLVQAHVHLCQTLFRGQAEELELLDYLDVLDNVLLPYRLTPVLELDGAARSRALELLGRVGLGDKVRRPPGRLSQGERQRVAVCRALVTRPAVVLGDEPTGNLDTANRDHVVDALLGYGRDTGAPVVFVTHDHELLPRFDRVLDVGGLGGGGDA